jgi:protein-disulfide isomerase
MFARLRLLAAGLCAVLLFAAPAGAQGAFSSAQKDEIRKLVREYLIQNPEVLEEAQQVLEERRLAAQRQKQKDIAAAIFADPRVYKAGPENAPVQLIEFYDYNCGFCKRSVSWTMQVISKRKDVRVALVDFPILAESSMEAARAAVASVRQGRHLQFHQALMSAKGQITSDSINAIARQAGVDVSRMRRDMMDPAISALLDANRERAVAAGVEGTPTFFVNGESHNFGSQAELIAAIDAAKKAAGGAKRAAR